MPAYTTVLGLYKPGGGSTGQVTPDEPVDVDKINGNFDLLDSAVGLRTWATPGRPSTPFVNQLGYNSTLDIYERWSGSAWEAALPKYLQAAGLASTYFTQTDLTGGKLDSRYFTQAQLLTGKKLDSVYYSKAAIKFDSGASTINTSFDSGSGRYTGSQHITFATKFTSAPVVATGINSSSPANQNAGAVNVTTTGFDLYYTRDTGTNTSVSWVAIGS